MRHYYHFFVTIVFMSLGARLICGQGYHFGYQGRYQGRGGGWGSGARGCIEYRLGVAPWRLPANSIKVVFVLCCGGSFGWLLLVEGGRVGLLGWFYYGNVVVAGNFLRLGGITYTSCFLMYVRFTYGFNRAVLKNTCGTAGVGVFGDLVGGERLYWGSYTK